MPTVFDLETNSNNGIYRIDVTMKYMVKQNINRKKFNCNPKTTMISFTDCAFKNLNHFCSVAIDKIGSLFNETKFCKNASLFHDNVERAYDQLSDFLHPSGIGEVKCIRPCKTVRYEATLQKKNENGKVLKMKWKNGDY